MFGAFPERPRIQRNRKGLREAKTVYDIGELNSAVAQGSICLVRRKEFNAGLNISALLLRNRQSGEYVVVPDRKVYQQYSQAALTYEEAEWALVQTVEGYARQIHNESNWGAYVLPADAEVGERFFIPELIEDLVASTFWYSVIPAETAEATWDGSELIIDHSSYRLELVG